MTKTMKKIPIILLCIICSYNAWSQISITGGANFNTVRNNDLLENQKPEIGFHLGGKFRFYPFAGNRDIGLQTGLMLTQKGYRQDLDENYKFSFYYFSLPILGNYAITDNFSVQGGFELAQLVNTSMKKGTETYNTFDLGIVAGASALDNHIIGFHTKIFYGLLPMLDYYEFDKYGSFTNEISDLKNFNIQFGININIFHEKILFNNN